PASASSPTCPASTSPGPVPADRGRAGVRQCPLGPQGPARALRGEAEGGGGLLPGAAHPPGPVPAEIRVPGGEPHALPAADQGRGGDPALLRGCLHALPQHFLPAAGHPRGELCAAVRGAPRPCPLPCLLPVGLRGLWAPLTTHHLSWALCRTNERFSFNATAAQPQVRAASTAWHGRALHPGGERAHRGSNGSFLPTVLQVQVPRGSGFGDREGDLSHGLPLLRHLHPGHPGRSGQQLSSLWDPWCPAGLTAPLPPQCPVYDLDNNVAFIGMYQTMTKKAAITVQKKDFPSHSFYVVVVVKTEDEACGGALPYYPLSKNASPDEPVDQHNRQKTLEVMVSPAITSEAYVRSVLFCLGIFLSFYILTLLIACWESCRQHKKKGLLAAMDSPSLDTGHSRSIPSSFLNHGPYDSYGYGSFGNGSSSSTEGITDSLGSAEVSYSYVGELLGHWCGRSPAEPPAQWHPGSAPSISGKGPGAAGPSVQPPVGSPAVTHLRELCSSNSGFPLKGRSSSSGARPPPRRGR
uniref:SID1 transmembrane family member 2 n=1 Tax=Cyanistes caeruleus TaxID=156563 RepID=A0A8C0TYL4_CYACU